MDRTTDSPGAISEPDPSEQDGEAESDTDRELGGLGQTDELARLGFKDEMVHNQAEHQDREP